MQYRANYREIDLDALRHNVRQLRKATAKDARLMAVVKSDAYGHGMVQVARAWAVSVRGMLRRCRMYCQRWRMNLWCI